MRIRRIAVALAAVLSASAAFGLGPELIVNGSFEKTGGGEGKAPFAGWTAREWDDGRYTFAAGAGREGGACAVISCVKQGRGGIGQVAPSRSTRQSGTSSACG